jgi:hypothetical protein
MEILAKESDWTPNDEERFAAFLETETGKRLIPALAQTMPGLMACGQVEAILIRSGEVRAFQNVIENLIMLAHPPQAVGGTDSTEYVPLERDDLWKDGQKLTPERTETPEFPTH